MGAGKAGCPRLRVPPLYSELICKKRESNAPENSAKADCLTSLQRQRSVAGIPLEAPGCPASHAPKRDARARQIVGWRVGGHQRDGAFAGHLRNDATGLIHLI